MNPADPCVPHVNQGGKTAKVVVYYQDVDANLGKVLTGDVTPASLQQTNKRKAHVADKCTAYSLDKNAFIGPFLIVGSDFNQIKQRISFHL